MPRATVFLESVMSRLVDRVFRSRDLKHRPVFPAGIKEFYAGENPVVDICFVHGLSGDWERTWTAEHQTRPWPETLLPPELPDTRILTFGYDAYVVRKGVASRNGLNDHAINLLHSLARTRDACPTRPLIFVAHSLGGIVCKKTLLLSREDRDPRFRSLADATVGVAFLGTPHQGAPKAVWAKAAAAAVSFLLKSNNKKLLRVLCPDDAFLEDIRDRFVRAFLHGDAANGPLEVACFFEELPVSGFGVIVDRTSATLGGNLPFSIHANHMDMAKFAAVKEPGFLQLLSDLKRWAARPRKPEDTSSMSPEDVSRYAQQCQRSLEFTGMEARAGDISLAAQGTCQWLLEHTKYLVWSTTGQGLFWIKGNPGSGKSTLLKHTYLHRQKSRDNGLLLSFFFHDRGSTLQKTPLGFYRSLSYQLLCTLPTSVVDLVDVYQTLHALQPTAPIRIEDWKWTEEDLQQYILRAISKILDARAVWLFVDALDEAGEENAVAVFRWLCHLVAVTTGWAFPFRLCVSCRPYPVISLHYHAFEICVEKENTRDIETYVRQQLQTELDGTSTSTADILDLIVSRANGIFLWARLVVGDVIAAWRDGKSPSAVRNVVNDTPGEVSALYERQILAMKDDKQKEALALLQWVCFSARPLLLNDLRWALAIPEDCEHASFEDCDHARDVRDLAVMERHVRAASRGLVEISVSWQTDDIPAVQFIHQTAKEYVVSTGLAILRCKGDDPSPVETAHRAHVHLAKICLQHLAKKEVEAFHDGAVKKWPFFLYVTHYWPHHLQLAECTCQRNGNGDCTHVGDYQAFLRLLRWPLNDVFGRWEPVLSKYSGYRSGSTLLHILAKNSCVSLLRELFRQTPHMGVDPRDHYGDTPLMLATRYGDETTVRLFLDKGADPNKANIDGRTALIFAIRAEDETVVRLLIEKHADLNRADKDGDTPLILALHNRDESIARLLLDRGADPHYASEDGSTALILADRSGQEGIVRLLLEKGADPNYANKYSNNTALILAACGGHEGIVRLLLEQKANPNLIDNDGDTALILAAWEGHEGTVRLLLEQGANPNLKNKDGDTALSVAISRGHEDIELLLREAGGVASSEPTLSISD